MSPVNLHEIGPRIAVIEKLSHSDRVMSATSAGLTRFSQSSFASASSDLMTHTGLPVRIKSRGMIPPGRQKQPVHPVPGVGSCVQCVIPWCVFCGVEDGMKSIIFGAVPTICVFKKKLRISELKTVIRNKNLIGSHSFKFKCCRLLRQNAIGSSGI